MDLVPLGLLWYAAFVFSASLHEACHSLAAMKLGDMTAYHHGQVSLDPFVHIKREPLGMVVVPIVSFILGGWMIGWASAPYDPYWAHEHRKKAALMALAGPLGNLLLLLLAAIAIHVGIHFEIFYQPDSISFTQVTSSLSPGFTNSLAVLVSIVFTLNLILFVFNLIPLPPLDGSNFIMIFLSDRAWAQYSKLLYHPSYRIIGLLVAWQIFGYVFEPIHLAAINLLYPGAGYH